MINTHVKKTKCPACGAPKVENSRHVYVYCDYCGSYMDFDYEKVLNGKSAAHDVAYVQRLTQIIEAKEQARLQKDQQKYTDFEKEYYILTIEKYPNAYPVRVRDPDYRDAFLDYMTGYSALQTFDETIHQLSVENVNAAYSKMKYEMINGQMMYDSGDFWQFYCIWYHSAVTTMARCFQEGIIHPDSTDPQVQIRSAVSIFLEAYRNYLYGQALDAVLKHSGLISEYIKLEIPDPEQRNCGQCGDKISVHKNTKQKVCESCGYLIDLVTPSFPCPECGALLSAPVAGHELHCPYCQSLYKNKGAVRYQNNYGGNPEEILSGMLDDIKSRPELL